MGLPAETTVRTPPSHNGTETPIRGLRPTLFYAIVALIFASDQATKAFITRTQGLELPRPVIGKAFELMLTHNHGGAWGVLPHGNMLFVVFAGVAIVALLVAYHRMARVELLVGTAFALALGGALGNLLDRLRFGYVVDFFYARIINFPVFNVADSAITLGIGLLVWHFLQSAIDESRQAKLANTESDSGGAERVSGPPSGSSSGTSPAE